MELLKETKPSNSKPKYEYSKDIDSLNAPAPVTPRNYHPKRRNYDHGNINYG